MKLTFTAMLVAQFKALGCAIKAFTKLAARKGVISPKPQTYTHFPPDLRLTIQF